jgi:hypothetical protein
MHSMKRHSFLTQLALVAGTVVPALLCLGTVALNAAEENLEKTFTVKPGGKLVVEVEFGVIDVRTNADNQANIHVFRKVVLREQADEEAYLQERPVTITQEGDTVTVRAIPITKRSGASTKKTEGRYTITVPCQSDVMLKTGGGAINVTDLQGNAKAESGGGLLAFTRLEGPLVGRTGGGNVNIVDCDGALKINTGGGNIEVNGGGGSLDGRSGGGSLAVKDFRGSAHIETGGGSIKIDNVVGKIDGSTAGGSITATLPSVKDEVKLKTSGGGVTLRAPSDAAFDLDASTAGGQAKSDLPVETAGKPSRGQLKGPVNGGGKPVVLRSSGGSVKVEKL